MGTSLEKDEKISERPAGFTPNRSRVDHVVYTWYTLGKIIQGRKDARLTRHCFFLDVMYGRPMTQYGGKGSGKKCGKLGSEGRCGE